ncbi:acyl carrier protein [Mycobacterium tuberculosis]
MGSRDITPSEAFTAWEFVDGYDVASGRGAHARSGGRRWIRCGQHCAGAELVGDGSEVRSSSNWGLRRIIAAELRVPERKLDTDRPFAELGLNSLMAMAIRREAEQFVGIELSAMLFNRNGQITRQLPCQTCGTAMCPEQPDFRAILVGRKCVGQSIRSHRIGAA